MNDEQLEDIAARVNHFCRRARNNLGLNQKEMAETLGYSLQAYRRFESSPEPDNRIVNSLVILHKFAALEKLSASDLASYLVNGHVRGRDGGRKLRSWESGVLQALSGINQSVRRNWSEAVLSSKKTRIKEVMELMTMLLKLDAKEILHIKGIVECLNDKN